MTRTRSYGTAALVVAAGFGLTACQSVAQSAEEVAGPPATVEPAADGGPATLTLTEKAVARLGITTAPVQAGGGGVTIPHAAVVYDADGAAWTFVRSRPGTYERAPITIVSVEGDRAQLSSGPPPGSVVVTVGAAELVGVEAGISGGE
jgi:hypothetical protein